MTGSRENSVDVLKKKKEGKQTPSGREASQLREKPERPGSGPKPQASR